MQIHLYWVITSIRPYHQLGHNFICLDHPFVEKYGCPIMSVSIVGGKEAAQEKPALALSGKDL